MQSLRSLVLLIAVSIGCGSGGHDESPVLSTRLGLSSYSISHPNFPCSDFLKELEKSPTPVIVFLYKTFGEDYSCLYRAIERFPDAPIIIHATNESGRRNGLLEPYESLYGLSIDELNSSLVRRSPDIIHAYEQLADELFRFSTLTSQLYVSTGLEDGFSDDAWREVYQIFTERMPGVIVYRNPLNVGNCPLNTYCEIHAISAPPVPKCIFNNDGIHLTIDNIADIRDAALRCDIAFLWTADLQGRLEGFSPPRDRQFVLVDETRELFSKFLELWGVEENR